MFLFLKYFKSIWFLSKFESFKGYWLLKKNNTHDTHDTDVLNNAEICILNFYYSKIK